MEVKYADNKLEKLCTDEREMWRKRADVAKKLKLRINALRQANNLGGLPNLDPSGKWHSVDKIRPGCWAAWVSGNHRIIIRPEGSGAVLTAVTVTVVEVEDYHKK